MIPTDPPLLAAGFHGVPRGHLAAVVTALEMTAAPLRAFPERADLVLHREPAPSAAWYRRLFREVGADWLWTSRLEWDDARLLATIHDPAVAVLAAVPAGGSEEDAVGLVELDFRTAGECEIAFFGFGRGWTGRGVGSWAMGEALRLAWAAPGVRRVWVHTCTLDDPRALGFYGRMGFAAFARQVEILPDPRLGGGLPREAAPAVPAIG